MSLVQGSFFWFRKRVVRWLYVPYDIHTNSLTVCQESGEVMNFLETLTDSLRMLKVSDSFWPASDFNLTSGIFKKQLELGLFCQKRGINYQSGCICFFHQLADAGSKCSKWIHQSVGSNSEWQLVADFVPNLQDIERAMQILYPSISQNKLWFYFSTAFSPQHTRYHGLCIWFRPATKYIMWEQQARSWEFSGALCKRQVKQTPFVCWQKQVGQASDPSSSEALIEMRPSG